MNSVDISVIVPIYNVHQYLRSCLESLVKQRNCSYEIICIDDCSTDDSYAIAQSFQNANPNLITLYRNEENIGQGRTREHGISLARGSYITFVDSDDYLAPDYLQTFYDAGSSSEADIVIGGYTRDCDGRLSPKDAPPMPWAITTYSIACAKIFRTGFLRENLIRFASQRQGEDIFFNIACYCSDPKAISIRYHGYYYRLNRNSTTNRITNDLGFEQSISQMFHDLLEKWLDHELDEQRRLVVSYAYFANMINALLTYGHGCGPQMMKRKLDYFYADAEVLFPNYDSLPIFSLKWQKGQTTKIKLSLWILMNLRRIRLDRVAYYLASFI